MKKLSSINHNQRAIILNLVREHHPISRARIREITDIRLATICALATRLKKDSLLREKYLKRHGLKGRRTGLLEINPEGRCAICIAGPGYQFYGITLKLNGEVVHEIKTPMPQDTPRAEMLRRIKRMAAELIAHVPPGSKIAGIGFVDPGTIDIDKGVSLYSTLFPAWKNIPIKRLLEKAFHYPVFMVNGQCARVLAEYHFGHARKKRDILFISYGTGMSCGIISGGKLIWGSRNIAGEWGHTHVLTPDGKHSADTFLEDFVSFSSLLSRLRRLMKPEQYESLNQDFSLLADPEKFHNAAAIKKELEQVFHYLSLSIANLVNLLNPELVILDANFKKFGELLLDRLIQSIEGRILRENRQGLKIVVSELGERAGPLGGGAMVIDSIFAPPDVPDYLAGPSL